MKKIFTSKMSTLSRILIVVASLLMIVTLLLPLWKIQLWAPQYPEGLSLSIWANKLTGDIQTVNILNHYIGMSPIDENSFSELQIFPKIFIGLMIFGFVVAAVGRRIGTIFYSIVQFSFSIWAIHDFYNWEYKFGHELNPDAAIKMDDMVYQPPLIGEKLFLNITATSWPDIGGIALATAVMLSVAVLILEYKSKKISL